MVILSKSPSLSPAAIRRSNNSSLLSKLAASPSFAYTFGYLRQSDSLLAKDNKGMLAGHVEGSPSSQSYSSESPDQCPDNFKLPPSVDQSAEKAAQQADVSSIATSINEQSQQTQQSKSSTKNSSKRQPYVANLSYPLRILGTVYTGLCISLGLTLVYVAQILTILVCYPITTALQRSLICAKILNVPMPKVNDSFNTRPKGSIYVINHLSNADPWICSGAGIPSESAWICKGDLFKIPIGGWTLTNSGHLRIDFTKEKGGWGTKKGAIAKMMKQAKEYIESGRSIIVYPEGVRNPNPSGPVGEFKLGFFTLAVDTNAQIIPVALSGSEKMWPVGENLFDSSRAYVSFGEPICAAGETPESLRDKTHKIVSEMRDQHPDRLQTQL